MAGPLPVTTGRSPFRDSPASPGHVKGGVTFAGQPSLEPLPVPQLKDTMKRWFATAAPLCESKAELAEAKAAITQFVSAAGLGPVLQQRLLERQRRAHEDGKGWLIDWWNDLMYLSFRLPIVINVSYFYQFVPDPRGAAKNTQVARAASLSHAAMEFRDLLVSERLPPDTAGRGDDARPMCMSMYRYLFHTAREAQDGIDRHVMCDPATNTHMLVIRKNRFFTFDLRPRGRVLTVGEIEAQLQRVVDAAGNVKGPPVGVLTGIHRDDAAFAFNVMRELHPQNLDALATIHGAAFAVCLDDSSPKTTKEMARVCLHGDGRNRWYDKTLQFIVTADGRAGFMGEHSMSDGMPTATMTNWMLQGIADGKLARDIMPPSGAPPLEAPTEAKFRVSGRVSRCIAEGCRAFDAAIADHEVDVCAFTEYGKDAIKGMKMAPDAFVQMSFQLAYYRTYGRFRATYEPAHTRAFLNGRTACIRGVGPESTAWVKSMCDRNAPASQRAKLLAKATAAHSRKSKEAAAGQDVDRHLFGMAMLRRPGEKCPLMDDVAVYGRSKTWGISTSNLTSEHYENWGWGEVVPDGLGIAYSVQRSALRFNVTCRTSVGAAAFTRQLRWALQDMRNTVLEAAEPGGSAPRARL